jgi:hypothetical protein
VLVLLAGTWISAGPWLRETALPSLRALFGSHGKGAAGPGQTFRRYNCHFSFVAQPGGEWKEDKAVKIGVNANLLALRRTDPNVWLTLTAQDYETRMPRDAEIVDEAVRRLQGYFKNLEWELKPDDQMADQRAVHFGFQGEVNHVVMTGDCYLLADKGIAYWLTTWGPRGTSPSAELAREELAEARKGFQLLRERDGWTEKRPSVKTFEGEKIGYTLRDTEGLWEQWGQPKDADADADMLLQGKDRIEVHHADKMAQVLVLVLPKQADLATAVKVARARLDEQQRKLYPDTKVELVRDQEGAQDRPAQIGEVPGHLVKLHVKNSPARQRFVVLAVVQPPNAPLLVIQGECDWNRRSLWDSDFRQLLSTFGLKK